MSILIKGIKKPMSCDDCIVPLSKCDFLQRRADECPIVEIPKAHWERHPTDREWDVCSNCGVGVKRREYGWLKGEQEWVSEEDYSYCPWCGAKMERRADESKSDD